MSLISMPFVGTGFDTGLHVVAGVVLIATVAAIGIGFWRFHEYPIHKANQKGHQQIALITTLTWIGFIWHWVWVIAVIVALVDAKELVIRFRDIWHAENKKEDKSC
ncbi:MFS transporter [Vibrio sp. SS-MA-C1-2]|uniref:MFS transporter n=1 Tax=Vibrio sp. SS-MA-C1-2 TaxID=2908646 RepID=UPI001F1B80EB|nr:MFS transporter [Vibrio sp. SS-MA-C1-2]UJF17741.1 MFS transporter [Vibrio sp. SS-MA-C1-2]